MTPFGAADGSISRCNNGNVVLDQVRTAYVSSPNPRYELRSVRFATVPSGCAGLKYTMKVLDYTSPYTELATLSGTVPASGTTVSWASNDGANLNAISSVNSQITITLVVHA